MGVSASLFTKLAVNPAYFLNRSGLARSLAQQDQAFGNGLLTNPSAK